MSFLRPTTIIRSAALRPALSAAPRAHLQVRYATQDYGSGKGDPVGENPQAQGKNNREDLEHPGPPPPKAAQKSQGQQSQSQSQSQSQDKSSSKPSEGNSSGKKGSQGAQPKILNDNPPTESEQDEDVRRHNEEMDHRADRAYKGVSNKDAYKDKV